MQNLDALVDQNGRKIKVFPSADMVSLTPFTIHTKKFLAVNNLNIRQLLACLALHARGIARFY
jgi:hypothetical protein